VNSKQMWEAARATLEARDERFHIFICKGVALGEFPSSARPPQGAPHG
jgi:hypothetical protein